MFHIDNKKNAKMQSKHPVWGKEARFSETCLLSVYERVRLQNDKKKKKNGNYCIWENKITLPQKKRLF